MPVGFVKDEHPQRGASVGLTCAACHTGELHHDGQAVRIDGGQGMGDLEQLQNGLLAALNATLVDGAKFERFAADVLGKAASATDKASLRTQVEQS